MTGLAVLQARMGSTRLPGKVLRPIAGRPLLLLMLERLEAGGVDVVVATSDREIDDPIADHASTFGVRVARGPEHDVLERFRIAVDGCRIDHVIRLTADCPLVDPGIVRSALETAEQTGAQFVSNSLIRTFPDGLDVEVIEVEALRLAADEATDPMEREHVTPFLYRHPERFNLSALTTDLRLGHLRWTIDTAQDLGRVRSLADRLHDPVRATWLDVLDVDHDDDRERPGLRLEPRIAGDVVGPASHPGARTWLLVDHDDVIGWLRVTVDAGHGTIDGDVPLAHVASTLDLLDDALTGDHQVTELAVRSLGGPS